MDFKQFFQDIKTKTIHMWKKGKIDRTFRITYDIFVNIALFLIITGVLLAIFAGGVGAGYFASLVKDEPIREYDEMKKDIYNYEETSKLFFADNIYIGDIRADLHREEVKLEDVSDLLKNAVIATEDELFYEHNGVVPKAIVRAIMQEATNSDRKTGGSTLTQQLIKNQILTNEVSFERKAKEILLAMRLEHFFEKDEILEAYLNIVPYGREASGQNIAGIQTAAKGIFGVDANELSLPQAAYLAGLPQNPFAFTPFTNSGELKEEEGLALGINRMKTVLLRMKQNGLITEKEYKEAVDYDITADFTDKSISPLDEYPAIVLELEKRAVDILKEQLATEDGYKLEELEDDETLNEQYEILADRALRRNGYEVHSTINKKMYDKMQKIIKEYPYFGPDRTVDGKIEQVENGMVLIENKTGKILSFVPGRDYRVGEKEFNHAFQGYRSPGSTFKPIAAYAPGFELGVFQPGSVIADIPLTVGSKTFNNYGGANYGLVTVREATMNSYNRPAVKAYMQIAHQDPYGKFLSKMGFKKIDASENDNASLPLGGLTHGVTVEENTNAFATFSNNGLFHQSYMIEKITDKDGNIVYEHELDPVQVFSPQTAYLTYDMMRDVVRGGTAAYLPSQLKYGGVDWAGKTGTSTDYKDAWFVGTNPNVTMGTWIGYDTPSSVYSCPGCGGLSYHHRNIKVWAQIVNSLTDDFPELMAPKQPLKQPEGIVWRSFCATSGLVPSKICSDAGLVQSDIFNAKFVPTKADDSLVGGNMTLVSVDGEKVIAGPNTPAEFTSGSKGGFAFNPEFLKRMGYDRLGDLSMLIPRKNSEKWAKIGFAGSSVSSGELSDNGSTPSAPGGLGANSNKISWSHANGQYIVGYRIYYASDEGDSFRLIGHTVDSAYSIPENEGVYHIRAVNYFGRESEPSAQIIVEKSEAEKEKERKQQEEEAKKKLEEKEQKEKEEKEKKEKEELEKKKKEEEKQKQEKEKQENEEKTDK